MTEYELRKEMLSVMEDNEISSIIWNKKRELSNISVPEHSRASLAFVSNLLSTPLEHVYSEYLHILKADTVTLIESLERELKLRKGEFKGVDLDSLKRTISISDVVRSYGHEIKNGRNIKCPFHDDRTASMHIYENTNSFKCFGCQVGGSQIDFIIHSDKCSTRQAIERLKTFGHIS